MTTQWGPVIYELFQLPDITKEFCAVTIARTFPNPLLAEVLGSAAEPATAPG